MVIYKWNHHRLISVNINVCATEIDTPKFRAAKLKKKKKNSERKCASTSWVSRNLISQCRVLLNYLLCQSRLLHWPCLSLILSHTHTLSIQETPTAFLPWTTSAAPWRWAVSWTEKTLSTQRDSRSLSRWASKGDDNCFPLVDHGGGGYKTNDASAAILPLHVFAALAFGS